MHSSDAEISHGLCEGMEILNEGTEFGDDIGRECSNANYSSVNDQQS
jgi:hypothetical protein